MVENRRLVLAVHSCIWMVFGTAVMLMMLMWLNRFVETKPKVIAGRTTSFTSVMERPKSSSRLSTFVQQSPREAPRKSSRAQQSTTALQPDLGSFEGGQGFGFENARFRSDSSENGGEAGSEDSTAKLGTALNGKGVEQSPVLRFQQPPEYPREARQKGITGYVSVDLLVDKSGAVSEVRVVASEPAGLFDAGVQKALRAWVFAPGTIDGRPTAMWVRQVVRFGLN